MKVVAIPPARDEEGVIGRVVASALPHVDAVIVPDDNSADDTAKVAEAAGALVVPNAREPGIAGGLKTAYAKALELGADVIVVMAGNGKDDGGEIPRLLEPIRGGRADFVQGSRYLPGGRYNHMPVHRVVGTRLYPVLVRLATGFPSTDATNGFRAFRADLLYDPRVDLEQEWIEGTAIEYYLLLRAIKLGYRCMEVPVSKLYPPFREQPYTKVRPGRDWWLILKPLVYLGLGIRR